MLRKIHNYSNLQFFFTDMILLFGFRPYSNFLMKHDFSEAGCASFFSKRKHLM